jgi:hypothetical protein
VVAVVVEPPAPVVAPVVLVELEPAVVLEPPLPCPVVLEPVDPAVPPVCVETVESSPPQDAQAKGAVRSAIANQLPMGR